MHTTKKHLEKEMLEPIFSQNISEQALLLTFLGQPKLQLCLGSKKEEN